MNVMNIKHYLSAAAALAMFAACSDYDPGISNNAVDLTDEEIKTIEEYTANFIERYGEMDSNHTWGFYELAEMEAKGTRQSDPNSNQWITVIKGRIQETNENGDPLYYYDYNGQRIITTQTSHNTGGAEQPTYPLYKYNGNERAQDFTIADNITIPGFPVQNYYLSNNYNVNDVLAPVDYPYDDKYEGWYHCTFLGDSEDHWFESKPALLAYMQEHNYDAVYPVGDVARSNDLNDPEVADVYEKFSEVWEGTNPEKNLVSYFVQQVWTGIKKYPEPDNGGTIVGGEHMDYLTAKGNGYTANDDEHFYNFNYSGYSNEGDVQNMMHIINSNTENFAYYNSYSSETMWDHYRLVYLHGNWYVGFDFESTVEGKVIAGDNVYNDWIVKIIPGNDSWIKIPEDEYITQKTPRSVTETRTNTVSRRVMCEDLGSTHDFDFNDLVFDVTYQCSEQRTAKYMKTTVTRKSDNKVISEIEVLESATEWTPTSNWTGTITLLASGGTLPIYIQNFDGKKYNVHELFGNTESNGIYSPVNVGTSYTHTPVTLPSYEVASSNPVNIDIFVYTESGERATNELELPDPSRSQYLGTNIAPMKICVPTYVRWTKEYQQIEWAYPNFASWVQSENGKAGFGSENDWTLESVDRYLYNP